MTASAEAVYGDPPPVLAAATPGAVQLSPFAPGSTPVEVLSDASLARIVVLAPPGTLERRYVLAHALRATTPGGEVIALAPKTRGGSRLADELNVFGCQVNETARRHHRICRVLRPVALHGLNEAIADGAPQIAPRLGLWSQPGVFSWDRPDPGSALLLKHLDGLAGRGADLGCGVGLLSLAALRSPSVSGLVCADLDRRAMDAARRNIDDPRVRFLHADVRLGDSALTDLDFVIMNPPFHSAGQEDRSLGLAFISAAANALRRGGVCRLVANIALPYEGRLNDAFAQARILEQAGGYKVYEVVK
jgi:16S rRNA (guanine1207-N2)-methyltransferase